MDYEITIIGAGIAGSVLASYLCKQGVEICLIDRLNPFKIEEDSEYSGRTAALNLASINLLAQLELWNDLKEDATDFDRIYVWDSEGSSKLEFLAKDIDKIKLGSVITNNTILKEISKTLESSANVDLKFNREIDGINTKNNSVEVITGEGEKINSERVLKECGPMAMASIHYTYDQWRNFNHPPPAIFEDIWDDYCSMLEEFPKEKLHQRIHAGHNCWVIPEEQRFLTPSILESTCLIGTKEKLLEKITELSAAGLDKLMILPGLKPRYEVLARVSKDLIQT